LILAVEERWYIWFLPHRAALAEAIAELAGRGIDGEEAGVVGSHKDARRASAIGPAAAVVPDRDAAADELVGAVETR
jgi:hypothetical protein